MGNNIASILFSPPSFWVCCQQPATLWTQGKPLALVTMPDRCSRPHWAGVCGKSRMSAVESPYHRLVRLVHTEHRLEHGLHHRRFWFSPSQWGICFLLRTCVKGSVGEIVQAEHHALKIPPWNLGHTECGWWHWRPLKSTSWKQWQQQKTIKICM